MTTALQLDGITRRFQSTDRVVDALGPIDVQIPAGEFVCLLGPSGCGKSTLLKLVAGLDRPTAGRVVVDGGPVDGPSPLRAMMFQESALFPWLTVAGNVGFGLRHLRLSRDEREARVGRWLEAMRLSEFAGAAVHELSGGMRQRAALARSLAAEPSMLLMDEPFASIDALTRDRLSRLVESIWLDLRPTMLLVTHSVHEAVALADRVLVFSPRPGRLVADVRIALARPRSPGDARVGAHIVTLEGLLSADGDTDSRSGAARS